MRSSLTSNYTAFQPAVLSVRLFVGVWMPLNSGPVFPVPADSHRHFLRFVPRGTPAFWGARAGWDPSTLAVSTERNKRRNESRPVCCGRLRGGEGPGESGQALWRGDVVALALEGQGEVPGAEAGAQGSGGASWSRGDLLSAAAPLAPGVCVCVSFGDD